MESAPLFDAHNHLHDARLLPWRAEFLAELPALGVRGAVLKSRGVGVFSEPPPLAETLPGASCVFSHAGSGLAASAFAAGRPQILAPRHGEADATVRLLEELGVGIAVVPMERKRLREAIERVHTETQFATAAQRAGQAAQAFVRNANGLEQTINALSGVAG